MLDYKDKFSFMGRFEALIQVYEIFGAFASFLVLFHAPWCSFKLLGSLMHLGTLSSSLAFIQALWCPFKPFCAHQALWGCFKIIGTHSRLLALFQDHWHGTIYFIPYWKDNLSYHDSTIY